MSISTLQWNVYKGIINNAHNFFNQDTISWFRNDFNMQRHGEDSTSSMGFTMINLKCLNTYNFFRTWPMTDETISGKLDKESMVVLLNKKYLSDLGYLTADGNLNFDPGSDYFIFQGQKMTSSGETPLSQALDEPLHIMLILKREPTETGSNKY